uniref:Uncharacterized protein n=1 Tax=Mustela putorius furo TaxID=9669 RepID=M3Y9I5_MUSPF
MAAAAAAAAPGAAEAAAAPAAAAAAGTAGAGAAAAAAAVIVVVALVPRLAKKPLKVEDIMKLLCCIAEGDEREGELGTSYGWNDHWSGWRPIWSCCL